MKKLFHYFLSIIIILLSGCSSRRYGLNKSSLLLQNYTDPYCWAGIVLGQSTLDETFEQLESLDFVDADSIYQGSGYGDFDHGLYLNFQDGYREERMSVWFKDGKAQALNFSGQYTLDEIQKSLGEVEKFVVYGWMYEQPMMKYYGYSVSSGYVILGSPSNGRNLDELEEVTLSDDSIFFVKLIHPDVLMYVQSIQMSAVVRDYIISEGYFADWHGYGEYEVVRPEYDLYMP